MLKKGTFVKNILAREQNLDDGCKAHAASKGCAILTRVRGLRVRTRVFWWLTKNSASSHVFTDELSRGRKSIATNVVFDEFILKENQWQRLSF